MKPLDPILPIDLFPKIDAKLIEVLSSLSPKDWEKQTIAPLWKVKDVAVHLLDTTIRTLSMARDGYFGEQPENINSYQDLVAFLNQLNADWVAAMKRVSPKVLIELLEITGKEYCEYMATLDPIETAIFSVAWAGEEESKNWFHIAREYTEKWHHQQQIRLAVGQEQALYTREFYYPHLDTSMRALPHHYRTEKAEPGDVIKFVITGEGGGEWWLYTDGKGWFLVTDYDVPPICEVTIEGDIAWRLFTKGISRKDAEQYVSITGNQALGQRIFDMLAVMA